MTPALNTEYLPRTNRLTVRVCLRHRAVPRFRKNHLGSYECKLCLTLHTNEGSYLAHTQGKKHQENLKRRALKEAADAPQQPAPVSKSAPVSWQEKALRTASVDLSSPTSDPWHWHCPTHAAYRFEASAHAARANPRSAPSPLRLSLPCYMADNRVATRIDNEVICCWC